MQFVYPNFLWALALIAIPIIVHLFYFRRYIKVYFSNTRFLSEVNEERASKNKLKHLLVLLSRILAISFLVFAFAQPFLPENNQQSNDGSQVSIFLDNSFSMGAEGGGQILFEDAVLVAKNIINAHPENSRFQILTNDFEGKHQRLVSKSEALNLLSEVKISSASQDYDVVFNRQKSLLNKQSNQFNSIYFLSDFQSNKKMFENDTAFSINLVPFKPSNIRNIYIDSVWMESPIQLPGQTIKLLSKVRNEGVEKVSGTYQLSLNGISKSVVNYEIDAKSYTIDTLSFATNQLGWNKGKLVLNDFPITFDDQYFFSFYVENEVRVLNIHPNNQSDRIFKAVFKDISTVNYQSTAVNNINYNELSNFHLIILDQLESIPSGLLESLKKIGEDGSNIFVAPSNNASLESYNQFFTAMKSGLLLGVNEGNRKVVELEKNHALLRDLFESIPKNIQLPEVNRYFILKNNTFSTQQNILSFRNGDAFLASFDIGAGQLFITTAPLNKKYNDFISNALFAPLIYKMAVLGVSQSDIAFTIDVNTIINAKNIPGGSDAIVKLKSEGFEVIPQKMIYGGRVVLNVKGDLLQSGFYTLSAENMEEEQIVALNFDRSESKLRYYSDEDLKNNLSGKNVKIVSGNIDTIGNEIKMLAQGKSFWKLCIIFTLLFLLIEVLLLRFLK